MEDYVMLFFEELGSKGYSGLFLFMLSTYSAFTAGHLFRDCFLLRNSKYFDWNAIWLPIVVLLISLLCGGFLLFPVTSEVRIVMITWIILSVAISILIPMDRNYNSHYFTGKKWR